MFSRIINHISSRGRIVKRARMRRLKMSNTFFIVVLIGILPVYPVFGSVLYNISGGIQNFPIDQSTILTDDYDREDAAFISADTPLDTSHEWADRTEIITYTVQEGDTLSQLSRDFRLTSATIRWVNALSTNVLRIGQKLVIPPGDGYVYTVKTGDSLPLIAKKYSISPEVISQNNAHISDVLQPGNVLYLPGIKPPVTAVATSVTSGKTTPYVLKLLAPK